MGHLIEIQLLGPLEVRVAGRPVEISRGRAQALLAVLAAAANQPVPAETVVDRIWGGEPPADPRGSVYTTVRRLRSILGPDAITSSGGAYALQAHPDDIDVRRFEGLLDDADRATTDAGALAALHSALPLWRGEPYQLQASGWLTASERPRLTERYLGAVERRIDLETGTRDPAALVTELSALTTEHPLREPLWLRLMCALASAGRPAEALAAYETVRRTLAEQLGADPGADLQSIHAELLAGRVPAAGNASPAAGVEVPRQLPADVAGFTGRNDALHRLDALAGRLPLVVVDGAGGVGKTSLAVHWANRVRDDFPGGQVFVDLRGFGPGDPVEPADALLTMLRGLGVPVEQIPPAIDARTALLRTTLAGRRTLAVLDNARDEMQVRPLLPGAGTMVLVTSRNQLRGLAARERAERIVLGPLPADEAAALVVERLKGQGVAYDEPAVARLAELCGYLPLALSVAAERAGRYPSDDSGTLRALTNQLDGERLDVLETGDDLSTSLRAVMSWSYRALAPAEARLLRMFAVQPLPELPAAAAAALAGAEVPACRRSLDRLVDAHLLDQPHPDLFRMHDLIRVYAAERVGGEDPQGSVDAALGRWVRWYAWSAINAQAEIRKRATHGPVPAAGAIQPLVFDTAGSAMHWFGAESAGLRVVMSTASALQRYDDATLLALGLGTYYDHAGHPGDSSRLLEAGLSAARAAGNGPAEVDLLTDVAMGHVRRNELELALGCLERAVRIAEEVDYTEGRCTAGGDVAIVYRRLGRFDEAIEIFGRTLELARRHAIPMEAGILNSLALTYVDVECYDEAVDAARESVRLRHEAGQFIQEGIALDTFGTVYLAQDNATDALHCFERALELHRKLSARWLQAHALSQIGRCRRALGDTPDARTCWEEALRIMDEIHAEDNVELSRTDLRNLLAGLPDS